MQTSFRYMVVEDRLIATVASIRAYVVFRPLATTHAVPVTAFAHTVVIIFRGRALRHAKWTVSRVFAFLTVIRVRPYARTVALLVAHFARLLIRLVDSWRGTILKAIVS